MRHLNIPQALLCLGVIVSGISIGGHIAGHIMFGLLMFVGLVALVENVPWIKAIVYRTNVILDIIIFGCSILATIFMGVTITGAITVASLIFSLVYAPYIRNLRKEEEDIKKEERGRNARYKRP